MRTNEERTPAQQREDTASPEMREDRFSKTVWEKLSAVDVSERIQKKGDFNYLSWPWAWATLMENYPESTFKILKEKHHTDTTVETRCKVTVSNGEDKLTRFMWLPVMDYKNNAVKNPTSRHISDSRMRCFVKCIALFGLGHEIYAGEDVPGKMKNEFKEYMDAVNRQFDLISLIKESLANDDFPGAVGAYYDIPDQDKEILKRADTKGCVFNKGEIAAIASKEWIEARDAMFDKKNDDVPY
jgi:hypothetical protein